MALSDVIKKKQATGDEPKADKAQTKNPLDDVRVVIGVIAIACIGLIVMIVFGTKGINETLVQIDEVKSEYKTNQASIANLLALQSRSQEYMDQRDQYNALISSDGLDQQQIMIDMENDVEAHNCILTNIVFGEQTATGSVKQIAVTISMSGTYDNIMQFCHDTVNGEQIKRIDTIKMTASSGGNSSASEANKSADIVIVLFSK